ncbi:MAG: glycoside hydrolase family 15 protein [Thermoplasmata archaeon]|nr:glycoside hydrolase family 15 protein [Thermoplasmata archaeon]
MITQLAGNGRILLTLNEAGEWIDLYAPYPGQYQHLREMRLGVYDIELQKFRWLRAPGDGLHFESDHRAAAYAPQSTWRDDRVQIRVQDHVHPNHDLIIRRIGLTAPAGRAFRVFQYHSLNIGESPYQETAYIDPESGSVIHYKRRQYFEFFGAPKFDVAGCGEHTLKGLRGTYVDAEDGRLEGRKISHGSVDSAVQWNLTGAGDSEQVVRLFIALGENTEETGRLRESALSGGNVGRMEREAEAFWKTWLARHPMRATPDLSPQSRAIYRTSVLVLRHVAATNGSIIASPDRRSLILGGDTYNYCWWRDGGYVAKAMDEAGLYEYAERFLNFALSCQSSNGSFRHRHFPDGAFGSSWHPPPFLQIDQTGTVLAAVWHHFKRRMDLDVLLEFWPMVKSAADFLLSFRDPESALPKRSYDLWEERDGVHFYSTAVVSHALERAARIGLELGKDAERWRVAADAMRESALERFYDPKLDRFVRSLDPRDERLDSSMLLAFKLGLISESDPRTRTLVDAIEQRLWSPRVGGLARYEGDEYYGHENPWIVSTLWLAEARLLLGDRERCRELLEWVVTNATPSGLLAEQIDSTTKEPRSATPLTWSHSTFVDVMHKFRIARDQDALADE